MIEKTWSAVANQPLLSNGTSDGVLTVPNACLFKVGQLIFLSADSLPTVELKVKLIPDANTLEVGLKGQNIHQREDVSAYTVGGGAFVYANKQPRPAISPDDVLRAVYDEEPSVAMRSILVDRCGDYVGLDPDAPFHVRLSDGSVNIGSVNAELEVQLSHIDNSPDPGDVHDSVRIGDGVREVNITPSEDDSKRGMNVVELAKPFTLPWNAIRVSAKNDCNDPTEVITSFGGVDVQMATIVYDDDGDFEELTVQDL